jgi:5-methylcytosine-specific restriction endonuclease McrA
MECFFFAIPPIWITTPKNQDLNRKAEFTVTKFINRVLCRGCGIGYERTHGVTGKFCSTRCKLDNPKKKDKCKPHCHEDTLEIQNVTFKNGDEHTRQVCKLCRNYKYLPRGSVTVESFNKELTKRSQHRNAVYGGSFYSSREWLSIRYDAFQKYGRKCAICNDSSSVMHVDHIKPRSRYPELSLSLGNLQILCRDCNLGKSDKV